MIISTLIEKIIEKSSKLSPVVIIDEVGVFAEIFEEISGICCIEEPSNIALTTSLAKNEARCFYLKYNMDISGFVASGRVKELLITPELILNRSSRCIIVPTKL